MCGTEGYGDTYKADDRKIEAEGEGTHRAVGLGEPREKTVRRRARRLLRRGDPVHFEVSRMRSLRHGLEGKDVPANAAGTVVGGKERGPSRNWPQSRGWPKLYTCWSWGNGLQSRSLELSGSRRNSRIELAQKTSSFWKWLKATSSKRNGLHLRQARLLSVASYDPKPPLLGWLRGCIRGGPALATAWDPLHRDDKLRTVRKFHGNVTVRRHLGGVRLVENEGL